MSERMDDAAGLDDLMAQLRQRTVDSRKFVASLETLNRRGLSHRTLTMLADAGAEAYAADLCARTAPLRLSPPARVWAWLRAWFGADDPREVQRVRAERQIAAINDAAERAS